MKNGVAKSIGILLIALGALGLAYSGVNYFTDTQSVEKVPVVLEEKDPALVLVAVSAANLALGVLLLVGSKKP